MSWSPANAVTAVSFVRAGPLQSLTPLYERTVTSAGAIAYIGSFAESSNSLPLTLNAAPPGDRVGTLQVAVSSEATPDSSVTLAIEPLTATLSNQTGTVVETTASGTLTLSNGTITVAGASTATAISSSVNPSAPGQPVTFTATITSDTAGDITGTVQFKDGSAPLAIADASNGQASFTTSSLSQGSHSMTAEYAGNSAFSASTSPPLSQSVSALPFGAPSGVTATAASASQVVITWYPMSGVDHFDVFRSSNADPYAFAGQTSSTLFSDVAVTGGTTYLYYVVAVTTGGTSSANSSIDPATTIIFADDPIVESTVVKAVHVSELRTAINAFRRSADLSPATFIDTEVSGTAIRATHIQQLRDALKVAGNVLGLPALTFTDDPLSAGSTIVKGVHVHELRSGVK